MRSSVVLPEEPLVLREQLLLPKAYVAPRTATERRLAEIWRNALTMDRVGIDDNYNDLGGDSFLAAVIFDAIHSAFQATLPMAILAEAPTVAALGRKIDDLSPDGARNEQARSE